MNRLLSYIFFLFFLSCNSSTIDKSAAPNIKDTVSNPERTSGFLNTRDTTIKSTIQSDIAASNMKCDSMSRDSIYRLAEKLKNSMQHKHKFSNEEAISLLRVYNSFHLVNTISKPISRDFAYSFTDLFRRKYLSKIIKQLGFTYRTGMTIYCRVYDINVYPSMYTSCKDYYTVY